MSDINKKICPRCKRLSTASGFRKNPLKFDNEICWKCNKQLEYHQEQNKISHNELGISIDKAKELVFNHYGKICNCCGELEPKFLEIDHVNNDGAEHRRMIGKSSIYVWILNNNFPIDFQILCANCNRGKYRNGGICPHQNNINRIIKMCA